MLREDPLTFEVLHLHKYRDDFIKFIGIDIALESFFKVNLKKMIQGQYQFQ
jgi:hypothetical protein